MKGKVLKTDACAVALCCLVLVLGFSGLAQCQESGTALLLQMVPEDGGTLNISSGVHVYEKDAEVTLTAVPKPGYQFVCWQGNVVDASSSSTLVLLDSPKIVVAVFERSKFELVDMEEEMQVSLGSGGLYRSPYDYAAPLEQAIGGKRYPGFHWPSETPPKDDFPVPPAISDFPAPTPEPTTITFFVTGIMMLVKYRAKTAGRNKIKDGII
jgi:hypothetical protein